MKQEELGKLEELIEQRKKLDEQLKRLQRNVTLLFVDIVGSTSYFDRYGDVDGVVYVHNCIDRLTPVATQQGGTICKTIGDAIMAYFTDPVSAVQAAVDMQHSLDNYNKAQLDEADKIRVRIGLNYGPGLIKEKDVFGDVVNVAARIESLAKGEQIFVSGDLEEQVRKAKIPVEKVDEVSVKGKKDKVVVYEIQWRKMKASSAAEQAAPQAPALAARVPVSRAAEPTQEQKGTVVLDVSPVAVLTRQKLRYSLVVVRPDGTHGQSCKLENPVTVLGRVEGDILFPDDSLVSRKHARFCVTDDGVVVEDLRSANGIYWRLRDPHSLQHQDVVLMGRQMFRFATKAADGAQPAGGTTATKTGKFKALKPEDAKAAASAAELIRLLPGGIEENHYPLSAGENTLGRTRGTVTFPEDPYLSSQHAKVRLDGGKWILEDLNSGNGTFVGVRERATLRDGDILLIGHQLLRVTATAA